MLPNRKFKKPRAAFSYHSYIFVPMASASGNQKILAVERLLRPILLIFFSAYTISRIFLADITWDEAATWLSFARFGFWKPEDAGFMDANNHLLNTLYMVFSTRYLGSEVWMLRLHMVFFSLLYLVSAYLLTRKIKSGPLARIFAFTTLAAQPYLLDFLSLARGYGMSLAFSMAAWYLLFKYIEKPRLLTLFGIIILTTIAVTAYFGQLNQSIALWLILLVYQINLIVQRKMSLRGAILPVSLLTLIPGFLLCWLIPLLLKMQQAGNFYAGGQEGLLNNTLLSLTMNMQYGVIKSYLTGYTLIVLFALAIAAAVLPLLLQFLKKDLPVAGSHWFPAIAGLTIILALLSLIVQHELFGTPYPRDRMSVIFLPAILICFIWARRMQPVLIVLAPMFLMHFLVSFNLNSTFEWRTNAGNLRLFEKMIEDKTRPDGRSKIFVAASEEFFTSLNYYRLTKNWHEIEHVFHEMEQMNRGADFFIRSREARGKFRPASSEQIVYDDLPNGNSLSMNKLTKIKADTIHQLSYQDPTQPEQNIFTVNRTDEFKVELKFQPDSVAENDIIYYRANLELFPPTPLTNSVGLVFAFECDGGTCDYRYFNLYDQLRGQSGKWAPLEIIYPVFPGLISKARVKIYLWNNTGQYFLFRNFKVAKLLYKNG
jgi:hypothetical protein